MFQRRLFFPFLWLEIEALLDWRARPKGPCRSGWQNLDAFKHGAILQYTPARNQLPQATWVGPPELGAHRQDRFGFCAEVECISGFVVIQPVHSISIVE